MLIGILIGFCLGLFTSLFCIGWLDERSDAYAGIKVVKVVRLSSNYTARLHEHLILCECAYCRKKTNSIWCEACKLYYCAHHALADHKNCGLKVKYPATYPTPTPLRVS